MDCSASSEAIDSTLAESSGKSLDPGRLLSYSISGVVVSCGWCSQQNVSRFHILQLRFSNRRPSSIDSAHLEKTGVAVLATMRGRYRSEMTHQSTCRRGSPHSGCLSYASCWHRPLRRALLIVWAWLRGRNNSRARTALIAKRQNVEEEVGSSGW